MVYAGQEQLHKREKYLIHSDAKGENLHLEMHQRASLCCRHHTEFSSHDYLGQKNSHIIASLTLIMNSHLATGELQSNLLPCVLKNS